MSPPEVSPWATMPRWKLAVAIASALVLSPIVGVVFVILLPAIVFSLPMLLIDLIPAREEGTEPARLPRHAPRHAAA